MIKPLSINNLNYRQTFSGYDKETKLLLQEAEGLFDSAATSSTYTDVFVYAEGGDMDLVKQTDSKEIALSKLSKGNILLQVADKETEIVDVFYHNTSDSQADKFFRYNDTKIYPWNKGRDIKLASDFVFAQSAGKKNIVEAMCKKYIPEFIELCSKMVPTSLLKNRL